MPAFFLIILLVSLIAVLLNLAFYFITNNPCIKKEAITFAWVYTALAVLFIIIIGITS